MEIIPSVEVFLVKIRSAPEKNNLMSISDALDLSIFSQNVEKIQLVEK